MILAFPSHNSAFDIRPSACFYFVLTVLHKVFWQVLLINHLACIIHHILLRMESSFASNFWYYRQLLPHHINGTIQALIFTQMRPLSEFQHHRTSHADADICV